jgi:hypothetical protein
VSEEPARNGKHSDRDNQHAENGDRYPMGHPLPFKPCGAKKRNGQPCRGAAMSNGRCRLHGGKSLAGIASPRFKHGRRSKYLSHLPFDLKKGYQSALNDEELLSLRDELGVQTALAIQLMDKMSDTDAPPWGKAVEALNDYKTAKTDEKRQAALTELERIIRSGAGAAVAQEKLRAELREVMQEKGRLASIEWKRLNDLQGVMTIEQGMALAMAVLAAAEKTVTDEKMLRALQQETLRLLPRPDRRGEVIDVEPEARTE